MDKQEILKAIKQARSAPKRNFPQTFDLIINLKDLNLKKPDEQVDLYITLPNGLGKIRKVCGLVGPELVDESKAQLDKTITLLDFDVLDKKAIKKLTEDYDFFVAQANIMPKVAAVFGRIFGPRNKMPNPKAGCVVPPKANLKPLKERLLKTVRVQAKKSLIIQAPVGIETMSDEEIATNLMHVYDAVLHALPKEQNNLRSGYIKLTMGTPIKVM
jgi:large subunit ribosomal protein L1